MSAAVDSSETSPFDGFEESSLLKRTMYTDRHHAELTFHRFSLMREKNVVTDAVISSSDDKMYEQTPLQKPPANFHYYILASKYCLHTYIFHFINLN